MPAIVTFDPINKWINEISVGGDNNLLWEEIYSEWKEWSQTSGNLGYLRAFRNVGGDPISDVQDLGATFFLLNGWRFKPAELSHNVVLDGNCFTDPAGDRVWVNTIGAYTIGIEQKVSNLTDSSVARLDLAQLQTGIYIDTILGKSIADGGDGTPTNPINNEAEAYQLAIDNNLRAYTIVEGVVTLGRDYTAWLFIGAISKSNSTVVLNGYDVNNCGFRLVTMTGTGSGDVYASEVRMVNLSGLTGIYKASSLSSLITPAGGGKTILVDCFSEFAGLEYATIDLGDQTSADLILVRYSNSVLLTNIDMETQDVTINLAGGRLLLDNTDTLGLCVVRGTGSVVHLNEPIGTEVITTELVNTSQLEGAGYDPELHNLERIYKQLGVILGLI